MSSVPCGCRQATVGVWLLVSGVVVALPSRAAEAEEGRRGEIVETIPVRSLEPEDETREAEEPLELAPMKVTGELLTRDANRTVSSVSVHDGLEIERGTAQDVYDVIAATPNASLDDSDYGVGGMTLRGIGSYGASGSGAYAAYGTSSAVVVDGVGLPRSALSYADLSAFDLETVEILRGPQSTGLGRNAMAGAVIINTVAPEPAFDFTPRLRGRFTRGDENLHQYAGAVEATLWPEKLALRLVHDDRADDGDIVNATRDEDDWARRDSSTTRLRVRLQPGGVDGRYDALLSLADFSHYRGSRYVPLSEEYSRVALANAPQDYDNHSRLAALEQRFRLSERWAVRAVSAYIRSETVSRYDTDYGASDSGGTRQQEDAKAMSQELRFEFTGEDLQASFGGYYYRDENSDATSGYIDITGSLDANGLCALTILCAVPLGRVNYASRNPAEVEDIAAFGEFDWSLTERLTFTAGLRLDRERNERVIATSYDGNTPIYAAAVRLLVAAGALPPEETIVVSREFSEVLPKIAVSYELFEDWFLGVGYAEGYRPGGDGYNQVSGRYFSFDSERTGNYELSFKGRHAPWRLQAALNLFYTEWHDMQIQLGEGTDNYMGNAGPAYIHGGELELRWRPLSSLQVVGGYGETHGRFGSGVVTADDVDLSGNRLPKAPEYSGVLALEWSPWGGLMIRPEVQWTGTAAANSDNQPQHELPGYRLLNLAVRWHVGRVGFYVVGTNLDDEHFRRDANNYSVGGGDVVSLGEGRRLAGGVEFEF